MRRPTLVPSIAPTLAAVIAASACALAGDVTLHPLLTSDMVLQRDQPIVIWGTADPGDTVTVTLPDNIAVVTTDTNGAWEATLDPMPAGGPYRLAVSTPDDSVTLTNVMLGDVWICSGQSNMDWTLDKTDRGDEFISKAGDYPNLRLLKMNRATNNDKQDDADTAGWNVSSPDSTPGFTAVGFHFGRIVHEHAGVPIGLIHTAWGGTPAESWTPLDALEAKPDVFADRLASLARFRMPADQLQRELEKAEAEHIAAVMQAWEDDEGLTAGWLDPAFDDAAWGTMTMPGYIAKELGSFYGIVWLRKTIELDAAASSEPAVLSLKRIDEYDKAYVNGVLVGEMPGDDENAKSRVRDYEVPAGILRAGTNVITIRMMNIRGSGGMRPEVGDLALKPAGDTIDLAGDWRYRVGYNARDHGGFPLPASYAIPAGRAYRGPSVLYNAMIHPLTRLGVKGAVWYQGEGNAGRGDEYRELFPTMIQSWRDAWTERRGMDVDLPFYFVQLPNFRQRKDEPGESSWADLREAQRLTLERLPNTGMAITIDIGDPADIHPTNKAPVGERLARLAIADLYGGPQTNASGPLYTALRRMRDGRVVVSFDHARGLTTSDGADAVLGFALADQNGDWHWADAAIRGDRVVVSNDSITTPTAIRYAWADNPAVNLVNDAGLPASPFQVSFSGRSTNENE